MDSIIRTEHLTYVYSKGTPFEKCALKDVSIEITRGDFVGIIGHTGSGKSTLISHFNGLTKPTGGKVFVDGQELHAKKDKKTMSGISFKVGLVFQYPEYQLFEETVYKDIAFGPTNMGLTKGEIDLRVRESLRFVGLTEELLQKSPFELSGGQKRRVAIAGVIAMKPEVLILDEPTAGLDPAGRDEILMHIKEYHKENKSTVLLVSHSMEDIAKTVKRVLVMNKSEVFLYGTVEEIFRRASELQAVGLSTPQITQIFIALKARGFDVNTGVFTLEAAKNELLRLKKEGTHA